MPIDHDQFRAVPDPLPLTPFNPIPSPLWPAPRADHASFLEQEVDRAACRALGAAYWRDVEAGTAKGAWHRLGTFRIAESEAAVAAAVAAYNRHVSPDGEPRSLVSYEDYLRLVKSPDDTHAAYLRHLTQLAPAFAALIARELPLYASEDPRRRHTYVLGTTRSGKSELLKTLIHSYATQPELAGVVALDPAGEFVEQIARWREFVGNDRLVFVRPELASGQVPTINPLEISGLDPLDTTRPAIRAKRVIAQQIVGAIEEIVAGGGGSNITLNMRALMVPCILALLDRPGSTLRDLQRFMDDDRNADLVAFGAERTHYEDAADLFQSNFRSRDYNATKRSIFTKFLDLFNSGNFAEVTCGRSTIDLERVLNERKIILFDLSKGALGENGAIAFGRLIVAMLQGIALRREEIKDPERRVPVHVFIDECHNFITPSIETILLEAGKYKFFMTLCQQNVGYGMGIQTRNVVTGMTHVKLVGLTAPDHWERTARLFPVPAARLQTLTLGRFLAQFGINAATLQFQARSDLVGYGNSMTAGAWERLVKRQLRAYYRPAFEPEHASLDKDRIDPAAPTGSRRRRPFAS